MLAGAFVGMIVRIVNQGKTERTKIENPQPEKPSMMSVASVVQFTKDVTGMIVNEIMTMVLGAPVVKTAMEKINPSDTLPHTISEVDKLKDQIANLQNDFGIMQPFFNQEMEHYQKEITKFVDASSCPPELREKCIQYFLEIKKVINGETKENPIIE